MGSAISDEACLGFIEELPRELVPLTRSPYNSWRHLRMSEIGYLVMDLTVFPVDPRKGFAAHDNGTQTQVLQVQ
jgi:hypothetical protein